MDTFWDGLYGGLREWFWWIVRVIMGYGQSLCSDALAALASAMPEGTGSFLIVVADYIDIVNAWVPIDAGVGLIGIWITARLSVLTVRHIIKFVPTLG